MSTSHFDLKNHPKCLHYLYFTEYKVTINHKSPLEQLLVPKSRNNNLGIGNLKFYNMSNRRSDIFFSIMTNTSHAAHSDSSHTHQPCPLFSRYILNLLSSATQARQATSYIQGCSYTEIMTAVFLKGICSLLA